MGDAIPEDATLADVGWRPKGDIHLLIPSTLPPSEWNDPSEKWMKACGRGRGGLNGDESLVTCKDCLRWLEVANSVR